ncbi:MAG: tRNA ((6))-methyltransferase TrmN6 [Deltaproteobacteria bacterium]|nr:tRNA ((6))-methyltransferase TrmN6 [Deltaproteobacteria bacterium]
MSARWQALRAELEVELGESITIDSLTIGWRIAQRAAGHRHSSDDVLTAHYALRAAGSTNRALDLGAGIGGVGLLVLWGLGEAASLVGVEAQEISYRLLRANIAGNQLSDRVEPRLGDLRELALGERFTLVTGSPPYFPVGTGVIPADSQKAHARFELRGDVGDYAHAAERHLSDDGVFVLCFPTVQRDRAIAAVQGAGLAVASYRDVVPRAGLRALFTVFACRRRAAECRIEPPLEIRREDGSLSDEMLEVRRGFGFPPVRGR